MALAYPTLALAAALALAAGSDPDPLVPAVAADMGSGALMGAAFGVGVKTDRWRAVDAGTLRVAALPAHRGLALGVTLTWR